MEDNRGFALLLALLVLSFLTILSGALLTTSTIDIWISDNYKTATQSLYVAEAGIDQAREALRASSQSPTELLNMFAGLPFLAAQPLLDRAGRVAGYYDVWLHNDNGDGMAALTDSNEILTLVSVGRVGSAQKTIEVTVQKGRFPESDADPRLKTVSGLEGLMSGIAANARNLQIAEGDLVLDSVTGSGVLLVRGELSITGDFVWNGLVLVVGQGVMHAGDAGHVTVNGGLLAARTRGADSTLLGAPSGVMLAITDAAGVKAATQSFPYNPIAIKER